ncbi:hypothetical protein PoB_000409600 [Plakobranchus ocellatus]|uniref:Uncharacterized protein n=1 Tax=Plakobranchus ocellatus TaxID=259542 RepID=A0AAV3Y597_9GAST|nr:hypothetical protein PoB_000409600 [Plakobranchus ocellatus]
MSHLPFLLRSKVNSDKEQTNILTSTKADVHIDSTQGANGGAQTRDKRVFADLRADSLATVPPTPLERGGWEEEKESARKKGAMEEKMESGREHKGGIGDTVNSEPALRSAGFVLSWVQTPPTVLWPDGERENLRTPCCCWLLTMTELAIPNLTKYK